MFREGDRVRLVREVDTVFVDPKYEYPGLSYDELARITEPLRLRGGVVARFESYVKFIPGLAVTTFWNAETEVSGLLLGRRDLYRVDVPTDALARCDPATPPTPLGACADGLPADHHFRTADQKDF